MLVQYAALSYCWGEQFDNQKTETRKESLQASLHRLCEDRLPQSLKDAIKVTRGLGLRYLWIDSVCIIQNDGDDMNSELGKMAHIFQNATVTISASRAKTCIEGFLGRRIDDVYTTGDFMEMQMVAGKEILGPVMLSPKRCQLGQNFQEPIYHRGWTMQEQVLSPRILEFGTQQNRWICAECEVVDGGLRVGKVEGRLQDAHTLGSRLRSELPWDNNKWSDWYHLLREYSLRRLKKQKDKLTALSAIAEAYSRKVPAEYLAGLWSVDFHKHLFWNVEKRRFPRPTCYRAPSWSWASVDGEIGLWYHGPGLPEHQLTIIESHIEIEDLRNPFGPIRAAWLYCQGYIQQGELEGPLTWYGVMYRHKSKRAVLNLDIRFDTWDGVGKIPLNLKHVYCLIVERSSNDVCQGLVLQRTDVQGCFRREGVWWSRNPRTDLEEPANKKWLECCQWMTLKII